MAASTHQCPNCGGSLGSSRAGIVVCRYCGSSVTVTAPAAGRDPEEVRELTPEVREEIGRLLSERQYVAAIGAYRTCTNEPLKQSKLAVDSIAADMGLDVSKMSGPPWSCLLIVIGFLAWMGLLAVSPFAVERYAPGILGPGVTDSQIETLQALVPMFLVILSLVIFFALLLRKKEKPGRGE